VLLFEMLHEKSKMGPSYSPHTPPGQRGGGGRNLGQGALLLQQVGYAEPSDDAISQAITANEQFIERLQAISDKARGLTVEQ
jgi:hypothetical protein